MREHGTRRLVATVLAENVGMLALARELGFVQSQAEPAGGMHEIHLVLQPEGVGDRTLRCGHARLRAAAARLFAGPVAKA